MEKTIGKRFKRSDYLRLDMILMNRNSELAHLDKDNLVDMRPALNATDAVSGATTTFLSGEDYV